MLPSIGKIVRFYLQFLREKRSHHWKKKLFQNANYVAISFYRPYCPTFPCNLVAREIECLRFR